ncbi:hypothetical protein LSCM1_02242 [Leishmania martiniquensis]|uniref:Uncharacterized protein n=1 Tax=Leishmania martiniquensis TaxID=1580590 RepID=A0A836GA10_9TRYP|nr:hypothetical protein LSCM1_02242 [Leishmania martiniquensis]
MASLATLLQWLSFVSLAALQRPFLPAVQDVLLYVSMSAALLFLLTVALAHGVADKEMEQYLTSAGRAAVPDGFTTKGNMVRVPFSYDAFASASVTMSVVTLLAVLLCCSFVLEAVWQGVATYVAPMAALTVNTVKPFCWDTAEDYRGKVPPPPEAST